MSKIKAIFKNVNWLRVLSYAASMAAILYALNGIGLMVEYGSWVEWDLFEPIFYAGISLGVSVYFSYLGVSFGLDALMHKRVERGLKSISDCAELRDYVSCAVPCPVCNSRKHLRFHIVHESDLETVYDFGCDKCGVCGYDAHDKTMAVAFWNRCVKEKTGHMRRAVFMTSKEYAEKVRSSGRYSDAEE